MSCDSGVAEMNSAARLHVSSDWTTGWTVCGSNPEKWARDLYLLQKVQTGSGIQLVNYSMGDVVLSRGQSGRGLKLCINLHLDPRLRISGVIPLFSLYAFMAWIGRNSSFFNSAN